MLKITGTIDGKQLNGEVVPVDNLIKMLGIKGQLDELKSTVAFDLGDIYKSQRVVDGAVQENMGQVNIPTTFTTNYNGSVLNVQYYEKALTKTVGKEQVIDFEPKKVRINSEVLSITQKDKKELVVFLLIHPRNKASIFYREGERWDFCTRKERAMATASLDFERMELSFKTQILEPKNIADTRLRAEAMGMGNLSQHSDGEVQSLVIQRYEQSKQRGRTPDEKQKSAKRFIQTFNEHLSEIKGAVIAAQNLGIIYGYNSQSNGKYVFEWAKVADENMRGKTILEVPKGSDHKEALNLYFTNNSETVYPILKKLIAEHKAEASASEKKK